MPRADATTMRPSRAALLFLLIGNIVIGSGVLAPAAMINAMTVDLGVSAVAIGALIGWGAVVLCIGAPAFGFLTNRMDRRFLLAASLVLYAVGHAASAFAPDYETLFIIRLAMISGAAIFTPQAASAVALMVPEARRASSIALVFMGWAIAGAVVVPFMSIFAETMNWRYLYAGLAVAAAVAAAGVVLLMPAGLYPARMTLRTWGGVLTRPPILFLLGTTCLQLIGQFTLYPYLAAELRRATEADATGVALVFGLYGAAGLFGSIVAARTVDWIGAPRSQLICLLTLAAGLAGWSLFSTSLVLTAGSIFVWGLGFGAAVSMQQARLIAVAPALASASVALNTSVLYLGQALGSAIGGALIAYRFPSLLGPAGLVFLLLAFAASAWAYRRFAA
ncbi:MAG: MFS transporter [Alphaproteobacteria bacterium]|nr:MFS transporter [Alphaproteobacteria bacterium]